MKWLVMYSKVISGETIWENFNNEMDANIRFDELRVTPNLQNLRLFKLERFHSITD